MAAARRIRAPRRTTENETALALRAFVLYRREMALALRPLLEQHASQRKILVSPPTAERIIYLTVAQLDRIAALVRDSKKTPPAIPGKP